MIYREERGAGVIETGAVDLHYGAHWQPWIRIIRRTGGVSISETFNRLKPVFATERAALRYAAELGRCLIDEARVFDPAVSRRKRARRYGGDSRQHSDAVASTRANRLL